MGTSPRDDVDEVVSLIRREPISSLHQRWQEAEAKIASNLQSSDWLLALSLKAIQHGVAGSTLIADIVSFLCEDDVKTLAQNLAEFSSVSGVEDLQEVVACQFPAFVPAEFRRRMTDYRDWSEHAEPLSPPASHHIIFNGGSPMQNSYFGHLRHPTWHLPMGGSDTCVGGSGTSICPSCNLQITHLITFETATLGTPVSLPRLVLETCTNCFQPQFYQHDLRGAPTRIEPFEKEEAYDSPGPIQRLAAGLAPTPDRWARQSCSLSNGRQNLFKIGGLPSWVQYPDFPQEPVSGRPMQFLLQFDSCLPTIDGGEVLWGSGGILYVYWDDISRLSCHLGQWT